MPIETIPGTEQKYYLISYDAEGSERTDDPDGLMSDTIAAAIDSQVVTDIFIFSHGWKGDIPAAIDQYNRWIGVLLEQQSDIEKMQQAHPDFAPLFIGFHWPSLPWGEEEFGGASFDVNAAPALEANALPSIDELIAAYAERIADTPEALTALRTIFESAAQNIDPEKMPSDVQQAYEVLNSEAQMGIDGEGGSPGNDREAFDPVFTFEAAKEEEMMSFGGFSLGGILSPLRQLSFWKMKDRARSVGEKGGGQLLRTLLHKTAPPKDVRLHLMGHSFGCIVVSAMLRGEDGAQPLPRPVDSVALIQGALSLWSYCEDIPEAPGRPGYFRPIISDNRVRGAMITTQSQLDSAVGRFYPIGAGIARQVAMPATFPKYGGVGSFGAQGPGLTIVDMKMLPKTDDYHFEAKTIYNLESSDFINEGGGASGAHSDIAKPEVAHAIWQAALT
jgi:hypothetical protein